MASDRRLHPISVLFAVGRELRAFALPAILMLVGARSAGWEWQRWALPLLVPYSIVALGRYLALRYRLGDDELVVRRGWLFRSERHVPYARIHNVDAVQGPLHRLLGVARVRIETGGSDEAEATLDGLPLAALEDLRRRVAAGRETAAPRPVASQPSPELLRLRPGEVALYGLVHGRGGVIVAAAIGLLWELGFLERLFGVRTEPAIARELLAPWLDGSGLPIGRLALAGAALLALVVLVRVLAVGWALVRLHGFRLTREPAGLRVDFGLLSRVSKSIPLHRIQTLTIREGPLHRLAGRVAVAVETAGAGGGKETAGGEVHWIAPLVRRDRLGPLLEAVLPGTGFKTIEWRAPHPRAFRRALKQRLVVAATIALPLPFLLRWWAIGWVVALVAWAAVAARREIRHLGWATTEDLVAYRSGWLWRDTTIARFTKVQVVAVLESPFDRRAGMARVRVDTAGASSPTAHRLEIPYLGRDTADRLAEALAARAARTAFEW